MKPPNLFCICVDYIVQFYFNPRKHPFPGKEDALPVFFPVYVKLAIAVFNPFSIEDVDGINAE